jgi:DNA-binding FadR family transcriptional regulator
VGQPLVGGAARVLEHIQGLQEGGFVTPGSRLPTERELAQAVDCTRTEVRHALAHLEIEGHIQRQVGRGTFLTPRPIVPGAATTHSASPADLMSARMIFEPQVVKLAAVSATEADFGEMRRCLAGGDSTFDYREFESWDLALHKSFAAATHNSVVSMMLDLLHTSRHDPVWGGLKRRNHSPETCLEYRSQHHGIVEALLERDPAGASAAMEAHLSSIRAHILS